MDYGPLLWPGSTKDNFASTETETGTGRQDIAEFLLVSAYDCLERLISDMTGYVLSGT